MNQEIQVQGKHNTAVVYADQIEQTAMAQIIELCNQEAFADSKIRIMPDCHAGAGCVIGFTADLGNKVIPNLVGVDIACGMLTTQISDRDIDFAKLDNFILNDVPFGFNGRNMIHKSVKNNYEAIDAVNEVCRIIGEDSPEKFLIKCGSLGGGNHFIEVDSNGEDNFLVIHSGSRNFGHTIARYFQKLAIDTCQDSVPTALTYLEGELAAQYLYCSSVAKSYAEQSRLIMTGEIVHAMDFTTVDMFETVHNYIDNGMIRKGAISAKVGERVLIPLNMRDGSIIGEGLGNTDWNCSGPHGAGRIMSRSQAKRELSLDDFKATMQGVYSSRVGKDTLDEAPDAYKNGKTIVDAIGETVKVTDILKPVYNFKA